MADRFKNFCIFSKFYGLSGVISWLLFAFYTENFTHFTREKTPQNNFSSQKFSVENNYSSPPALKKLVYQKCYALTTICFHENGFDQLRSTMHRFFGILVMS